MEINLEKLDLYAFCDPASGKRPGELKRQRARSAISVIGVENQQGRVFSLYAWAARETTDKLIDKIIWTGTHFKRGLRLFGIEANAMQSLFADAVGRELRVKGLHMPLTPIHQPTKIEKEFRIRSALQPLIRQGRLFIRADQHELKTELAGFPTHRLKDMVDALASAVALIPQRVTKVQKRDEAAALGAYLRETGANPEYIERRLRELRHNYST